MNSTVAPRRDPQAIVWGRGCAYGNVILVNGQWREVYAFFAAQEGSSYVIERAGDQGCCNCHVNQT